MNGVSHHVVTDDLEGATAVLHWLSTMPPVVGIAPAILPSSDPVDRSISYAPAGSALPPQLLSALAALNIILCAK